ncbi:hypothetical protein HBA55_35165 [Pseudomaricurvus alkylphenolicus]|uniref:hypothetical protein n=1 Tax=Pseudomaricurvus alkylphenolicus TaxID=1306991 RepID=UPI00141E75ED|nr:hypothetical protein [Pseudomaricurvus alkylphenolicus]NIB44872.1 hypothetical protein [Pseudomaricurvus alkylphenolicus]
MDIKPIRVEVTCLFCDAALQAEEEREYQSGDLIKCTACGEENDFDSVRDIALEKGEEQIKAKALKERDC